MKKLFVFLIAVLTLALMGCGGDAPKKDAAAPAGGDKQVLNLFSWADNFDPEVIAEFEKQNNCKVNYDVLPIMKNCWPRSRLAARNTTSSSPPITW